jgi:DNA-binding PadR family transcriptional regulator
VGEPRLTYITGLVLQSIAHGHRYGFEIMDVTGLPSGTVYPALRRMQRSGWIKARWESRAAAHAEGRPARRYYELRGSGAEALERLVERFRALSTAVPRAAGEPRTAQR